MFRADLGLILVTPMFARQVATRVGDMNSTSFDSLDTTGCVGHACVEFNCVRVLGQYALDSMTDRLGLIADGPEGLRTRASDRRQHCVRCPRSAIGVCPG